MGAEVIKIEDCTHKDPFLSGMFNAFDASFENWYEELNQKKQILRLDFKDPESKQKIRSILEGSQGLLLSVGPKLKKNLGLLDEDLNNLPIATVELEASSTHNKAMHDLNALAVTGLLSLHIAHETSPIVAPPFMPVAGIAFGQQVATQLLANIIECLRTKNFVKSVSYLHDTTNEIFHSFWSDKLRAQKRTKFLHNGAYPCYCLYRTADGHYAAVAAVEEKFWQDLSDSFSIGLPLEKRFETTPEAFELVASRFAKLSTAEIEKKAENKELCLSIVRKIT
jgi:crotonobetainyl-CoA:carnitine CoA-transferase CaiB-like acyl-CoA transferase